MCCGWYLTAMKKHLIRLMLSSAAAKFPEEGKKGLLFVAQRGKPASLKCGNAYIKLLAMVVGTSEKCGGRLASTAYGCNGKHECQIFFPATSGNQHNCRDTGRVVLFGEFECTPTPVTNVEDWTRTEETESRTDLFEGRTMVNRCPEGTYVEFSEAIYGAVGLCPGVDVSTALNSQVHRRSQAQIPLTLDRLGLETNPCRADAGFTQASLRAKGRCKRKLKRKLTALHT